MLLSISTQDWTNASRSVMEEWECYCKEVTMKESRRRGETVWCFSDKVTVGWPFWKPQLQHMSTLISTKQCTFFPFNCDNGLHTRFHVFLLSPLSLWISGIICPLSVLFLTLMIHFCGPMLLQKHVLTKCLHGYLIKIYFSRSVSILTTECACIQLGLSGWGCTTNCGLE